MRVKWMIAILVFQTVAGFDLVSFAELRGPWGLNGELECGEEVFKILRESGAGERSMPIFSLDSEVSIRRMPTVTLGNWIQVVFDKTRFRSIQFLNRGKVLTQTLSPLCELSTASEIQAADRRLIEEQAFTDEQLGELIQTNQKALIFVWSPRYVLSQRFARYVSQIAREEGYVLIGLVPQSEAEAFKILSQDVLAQMPEFLSESQLNASFELIYRGAEIHLPTIHIITSEGLLNEMIVGVHTVSSLRRKIRRND